MAHVGGGEAERSAAAGKQFLEKVGGVVLESSLDTRNSNEIKFAFQSEQYFGLFKSRALDDGGRQTVINLTSIRPRSTIIRMDVECTMGDSNLSLSMTIRTKTEKTVIVSTGPNGMKAYRVFIDGVPHSIASLRSSHIKKLVAHLQECENVLPNSGDSEKTVWDVLCEEISGVAR